MFKVELLGISNEINKIYLLNLLRNNTHLKIFEIVPIIEDLKNNVSIEIVLNTEDISVANNFIVSLYQQNIRIGNTNFHEEN